MAKRDFLTTYFFVLLEGFNEGVLPGVLLLSLCLLSGLPVVLAILFGPGFNPIIIIFITTNLIKLYKFSKHFNQ
uniref:hypothetical protein n=1 Tax=Ornithobacterium rhinotracheale TaxID=28251 RepID=UPI0039A703A3